LSSERVDGRSPDLDHTRPQGSDAIWAAIIRWRGVGLIGVAIVVTIWLGVTGQLILYINPIYIVFTVIMAVIALGLLGASFVVKAAHTHEDDPPTRAGKVTTILGGVLTLVLAIGMLVIPPATLSSATAIQRDVSASTVGVNTRTAASVASGSKATYEGFTVEDWSSLLQQTSSPAFYVGKPANVLGFITPDSQDPANVFFLTRFVITCCAVDAQPVAVPVYLPGWKSKYQANAWLSVAGSFISDPSRKSSAKIALVPAKVTAVAKPSNPYLY
jgi:putative membrane protein